MEKKISHYDLSLVKKLILEGKYKITRTALMSALNVLISKEMTKLHEKSLNWK